MAWVAYIGLQGAFLENDQLYIASHQRKACTIVCIRWSCRILELFIRATKPLSFKTLQLFRYILQLMRTWPSETERRKRKAYTIVCAG